VILGFRLQARLDPGIKREPLLFDAFQCPLKSRSAFAHHFPVGAHEVILFLGPAELVSQLLEAGLRFLAQAFDLRLFGCLLAEILLDPAGLLDLPFVLGINLPGLVAKDPRGLFEAFLLVLGLLLLMSKRDCFFFDPVNLLLQ